MPSTSKKQHNFMAAIANSPAFSKKVGIPQSVGKDFTAADKGRKFRTGGRPAAINKQNTQHGSMDMPFKSVRKFAGMKAGGKVKKYAGDTDEGSEVNVDTSGDSDYQKYSETKPVEMAPAPAAKPKIVTKEELAKSGMSLRDYMNKMQNKTRRDDSDGLETFSPKFERKFEKKEAAMDSAKSSNATYMPEARLTQAQMASGAEEARKRGMSSSSPKGSYEKFVGKTPQQTAMQDILRNSGRFKKGGNVKYNFEKSGKDVEKKGMKEGSKAEMALDKKQMMKKGGMPMKDGKPAFMMGKKMNMGGMAKYAAGGNINAKGAMNGSSRAGENTKIQKKGLTEGTVIRMASGGSVSSASRRADGIAQRGKTRC